ncbi:hypothetical protein ABTL37_20065, partial [Acinetobacter baumannii]
TLANKTITNFFATGYGGPLSGFGGAIGDIDRHASWVGHNLVGSDSPFVANNIYKRGIAYGANLWCGAIANGFTSSGGFEWND